MAASPAVSTNGEYLSLSDAALALKLRYSACLDQLLTGRLRGGKRDGKWRVTLESVRAAQRERPARP